MPRKLVSVLAVLVALACVPPVQAGASGVVISELRFRGPAGASDEFVELVNAGTAPIDVSGWRLQACSATTGAAATRATAGAGTVLAPGQHLLFANSTGYSGPVGADLTYATGIADGGGARVVTADGEYVDGAGSAAPPTSECREGAGVTLPTTDSTVSLERRDGTQDTDDNAADFEAAESDPQNAASVAPALSIADVVVGEQGGAVLTVALSAAAGRTVTVAYSTADGTAVAPDDYTAVGGVLSLAPGATLATVAVPIVSDALDEPDETFTVELAGATRATIADGVGEVTIVDDDEAVPPPPPTAGDPGTVAGAGLLAGRPFALFSVHVSLAAGDSEPRGHVLFVDLFSGVYLVSRTLATLRIEGGHATVEGTGRLGRTVVAFTLELFDRPGGDSLSISWPGYEHSAPLRAGGIRARAG